uniref:BTB domain-containing protein n=2 Tax=Lutzomyia longipalpis TaxID=7200 RepID=A0A1B0CA30_LUTLO
MNLCPGTTVSSETTLNVKSDMKMEGNTGNTSSELAWNYENEDNTTRYSQLFNNPIMSDFTFRVVSEDTVVPGHKFIMSLCSSDFYNIFNLLKLDHYELIIEDVSLSSFLAFLEYCYTMKMNLSDDTTFKKTVEVLKLAQRFHMASLVRICEDHIKSKVYYNNCMILFKNKDLLSPESAARREIMRVVEQYFSILVLDQMNLDILVDLPLKDLHEIARHPLLNCNENEVSDVLMKWAKRNCEKNGISSDSTKNLRLILGEVFYEIRFPSMQIYSFSKFLAKYPGMLSHKEISNICSYICDGLHASSSSKSCMGFKCTPRHPRIPNESNEYIYSMIPFGLSLPSFNGAPKIDQQSFQMKCEIETTLPRKLIGFAFFAKKEGSILVNFCELECMCDAMIPAVAGSK